MKNKYRKKGNYWKTEIDNYNDGYTVMYGNIYSFPHSYNLKGKKTLKIPLCLTSYRNIQSQLYNNEIIWYQITSKCYIFSKVCTVKPRQCLFMRLSFRIQENPPYSVTGWSLRLLRERRVKRANVVLLFRTRRVSHLEGRDALKMRWLSTKNANSAYASENTGEVMMR